jgi:hypothetical protein
MYIPYKVYEYIKNLPAVPVTLPRTGFFFIDENDGTKVICAETGEVMPVQDVLPCDIYKSPDAAFDAADQFHRNVD